MQLLYDFTSQLQNTIWLKVMNHLTARPNANITFNRNINDGQNGWLSEFNKNQSIAIIRAYKYFLLWCLF